MGPPSLQVLETCVPTCHPHISHYPEDQETPPYPAKESRNWEQVAALPESLLSLLPQDLADPATYRSDDSGHTNRLLEDQGPLFLCGGTDNVSINTAGFLWKPLQEKGRIQNFSLWFLQRLSLNSIRKGHRHDLPITKAWLCFEILWGREHSRNNSPYKTLVEIIVYSHISEALLSVQNSSVGQHVCISF